MALGPTSDPKKTKLGPQDKGTPVFGDSKHESDPRFMDGRLSKQHGEAGRELGFESSDLAKTLQKKNPTRLIDPKQRTSRQKRKKAELVKKLPPVHSTKTMRKLQSAKLAPTQTSGWSWVVASIAAVGASFGILLMYAGYFLMFIFMFFSEFVLNILLTIVNVFIGIIGAILKKILPILSGYAVYVGIIFISGYMFMTLNPKWFGKMKTFASNSAAQVERATGFPVPTLPDLDLFMNPQKSLDKARKISEATSRAMSAFGLSSIDIPELSMPKIRLPNTNYQSSSSFNSAFSGYRLPSELDSFSSVPQTPATLNYFKRLYNSGYLGNKAQGAVPMLENALHSKDAKLSAAARKSLRKIDSPGSRRALKKYKYKAEKMKRGTTLRR